MSGLRSTTLAWVILGLLAVGVVSARAEVDPNFDRTIAAALADPEMRETLEAESIETLQSETSWDERHRASRILAGIGTEGSVTPIAALLSDPRSSHLARIALEPMPYPAVDVALRSALAETSGPIRIGIMASIQQRRDAEAVEALALLPATSDAETAVAAARTLGHIGTIEAASTLVPWLDGEEPLRTAAAEACLVASDWMLQDGEVAPGWMDLLDRLRSESWPEPIRTGAFRASLRLEPEQAVKRILDAIQGEETFFPVLAIASIADLEGDSVTERFLAELPQLPESLQSPLLDVLAEREDAVPLADLHVLLQSRAESIRLTAIRLIAEQGDATSIDPLCAALDGESSRAETQALLEALRRLKGSGVNQGLIEALREGSEPRRAGLIDVLARRQAVEAWSAILGQIDDPAARPAAIKALGDLAGPEHLSPLLELLATLDDEGGRTRAEGALLAAIRRMGGTEGGGIQLREASYGVPPDGPWKDVTDTVAAHVVDGRLTIEANNSLFGDPVPGTVKTLRVDYESNGTVGRAEAIEGQTLTVASEVVPAEVLNRFRERLERAEKPSEIVSLLRVLSRLAGPVAYELVAGKVNDAEPSVHDAAVRALADWPDIQAVNTLVGIAESTEDIAHRSVAIRGSVRLLRLAVLGVPETLALYDRLIGASVTLDERRILLAGLADLVHPASLAPIRALRDQEEVRTEGDLALNRIETALGIEEDFAPIFDGSSLDGWTGEPDLWRVEDGHLLGETTAEKPLASNTFLVREGGEAGNFELAFRYRIDSEWANSGIQIRSERLPDDKVRGYQPDISTEDWITGICYEEGGRGILARRGNIVEFDSTGDRHAISFADETALKAHIHSRDWNEYHIVAWGNTFITRINGRMMHAIIDSSPSARRQGVMAFQLHRGPAMQIRFSDILLRPLPTPDETKAPNP